MNILSHIKENKYIFPFSCDDPSSALRWIKTNSYTVSIFSTFRFSFSPSHNKCAKFSASTKTSTTIKKTPRIQVNTNMSSSRDRPKSRSSVITVNTNLTRPNDSPTPSPSSTSSLINVSGKLTKFSARPNAICWHIYDNVTDIPYCELYLKYSAKSKHWYSRKIN